MGFVAKAKRITENTDYKLLNTPKRVGARNIIGIISYFGYSKQGRNNKNYNF
jgi:hypothetical protein